MLSALCVNMVILLTASWISYSMNEEAQIFGTGYSDLYLLTFSIPIITWINFLILQFVKNKKTGAINKNEK